MIDFSNIEYLKTGNPRQQLAYQELTDLNLMPLLQQYNPILAGTIPIDIDLPESDLDIICECKDHQAFAQDLVRLYGKQKDFKIYQHKHDDFLSTIANFRARHFEIEIFGQNLASTQQNAYRHMLIEHRLLEENGLAFKERIRALKAAGLKTEPAFAKLLGLSGNPYEALLKLSPK